MYSVLTSDLDPDQIIKRNEKGVLLSSSFTCTGTNWGGCDELDRTCTLKKIATVDHILLKKPLDFEGVDYDHGKPDEWTVIIVEIMTVKGVRKPKTKE